jgi:hypothetical protein
MILYTVVTICDGRNVAMAAALANLTALACKRSERANNAFAGQRRTVQVNDVSDDYPGSNVRVNGTDRDVWLRSGGCPSRICFISGLGTLHDYKLAQLSPKSITLGTFHRPVQLGRSLQIVRCKP